jgi:hypothetical protein
MGTKKKTVGGKCGRGVAEDDGFGDKGCYYG